jgi:hypothetical protein
VEASKLAEGRVDLGQTPSVVMGPGDGASAKALRNCSVVRASSFFGLGPLLAWAM